MTTTIWRAMVRLAAMALPVAVVACISGTDQPLGPVGQVIKPIGTGGGGSGTGGGNVIGVFHLSTFNGASLPDTVVNIDISVPDSTRTVVAILDSASLELDSGGTALETDYFQVARDNRSTAALQGLQFAFARVGTTPVTCVGGTYVDTLSTQTSFQLQGFQCESFGGTFPRLPTSYTVAGDSLVGSVIYQYYDSAATMGAAVYTSTVPFVWKYFSAVTGQHTVSAPRGTALTRAKRIVIRRD
jgi:hypothetical protein